MRRRIARALVLVLVLSGSTAAIGAPPAQALSSTPDPIKSRVQGKVYAQVHLGNLIYLAGHFTKVIDQNGDRHPAGSIAAFDLATGDWDPSFLPIVGGDLHLKVTALAISPDGTTLYAGGDFDSINGTDVKNLAAIDLATGQLDAGFAPTPGGSVDVLLAGPDLLYMGGSFSHVDGKRRRHLAAVSLRRDAQQGVAARTRRRATARRRTTTRSTAPTAATGRSARWRSRPTTA